MNRAANKAMRMQQIIALLLAHPEGMTQSEIARKLGVHRSTISRTVRDLDVVYEENGRLFLDRRRDLLSLHLSLHEALSLHLAARLLATCLDRQNAHASTALVKISKALEPIAPQLSRHIQGSALKIDELAHYDNPAYMHVLEALTEAWASGRKVTVWHRKTPADPLAEYRFAPYYIEPGAVGRSTYAIGLREPPGQIRTLKIERIEQAELTKEPYSIPPDFDPFELLADAWGIWFTGEEPVEVVLKFSPRAAGRVQETHWHRSQQIELLPDGSLIWRGRIAEPQEMMPFIRGWGADVEVLEPDELRNALRQEALRLARLYGVSSTGG